MSATNHNLDDLLAAVADGSTDDLSEQQIAALEEHLNASPEAAARLANLAPDSDSRLNVGVTPPTEDEWDAVWDGIEAAPGAAGRAHRLIRLWRPLAAAAACLLVIILWKGITPSETAWPIQFSDDVVVHEIEIYGDADAFVAYADDDSGMAMIWVLEDEGV